MKQEGTSLYKLTLDGGLMREYTLAPAIAVLKGWEAEGKIEIFETDRADPSSGGSTGWPGAQKTSGEKSFWGGKRRSSPKKDPAAAAKFGQIAAVVFPMRDTHKLNMSELNAINHLMRHSNLERNIFVTRNSKSFIDEGMRDKIQTVLKISVMTPEEAVAHLSETEGWPVKAVK